MSAKTDSSQFNRVVEDLKLQLKQNLIENTAYESLQQDEWLRTLYSSYTKMFINDNSRIWTTGSIMIPLSLAGFAALPGFRSSRLIHILTLAVASSVVMVTWLFIAENHRAFQQKSMAWIVAIEHTIGLTKTGGPKIRGNFLNRLLTFPAAVQIMRWVLTCAVVVAWIVVVIFWPRCL